MFCFGFGGMVLLFFSMKELITHYYETPKDNIQTVHCNLIFCLVLQGIAGSTEGFAQRFIHYIR